MVKMNLDVLYLDDKDINQDRIFSLHDIKIITLTSIAKKAVMISSVAIYVGEYGRKLIKTRY